MAECAQISADLEIDCDNVLTPGAEDLAWVINRDDWKDATITRNVTNPQIIEDIVLPSGAVAYRIEGQNNSILPKYNSVKGRYVNLYNHEFNFKVFKIDPATKLQLEKLGNGRVVVIFENKFRTTTGNTSFEVLGSASGLIVPDGGILRDPGDSETTGAYDVTLKSEETQGLEPHLPATIFITDYTTSKAVITDLEA